MIQKSTWLKTYVRHRQM